MLFRSNFYLGPQIISYFFFTYYYQYTTLIFVKSFVNFLVSIHFLEKKFYVVHIYIFLSSIWFVLISNFSSKIK